MRIQLTHPQPTRNPSSPWWVFSLGVLCNLRRLTDRCSFHSIRIKSISLWKVFEPLSKMRKTIDSISEIGDFSECQTLDNIRSSTNFIHPSLKALGETTSRSGDLLRLKAWISYHIFAPADGSATTIQVLVATKPRTRWPTFQLGNLFYC